MWTARDVTVCVNTWETRKISFFVPSFSSGLDRIELLLANMVRQRQRRYNLVCEELLVFSCIFFARRGWARGKSENKLPPFNGHILSLWVWALVALLQRRLRFFASLVSLSLFLSLFCSISVVVIQCSIYTWNSAMMILSFHSLAQQPVIISYRKKQSKVHLVRTNWEDKTFFFWRAINGFFFGTVPGWKLLLRSKRVLLFQLIIYVHWNP